MPAFLQFVNRSSAGRSKDAPPATAWIGVNNLSHAIACIAGVDGHLVLLAAQVGQAACQAAVLATWLCTPNQSSLDIRHDSISI